MTTSLNISFLKKSTFLLFLALMPFIAYSQKKAKPTSKFQFGLVNVMDWSQTDNQYVEKTRFTGKGEVLIYNDSIILTYSNEWECGTYKMYVDTTNVIQNTIEGGDETLTFYSVRSMGYHNIDGLFTIIKIEEPDGKTSFMATLDTKFDDEGFAMMRRFYDNINIVK